MKRSTLALAFSAALLCILAPITQAQIKTPRDYVAYWVEPYAGHLGLRLQRFGQNAARHGYIVEARLFDFNNGPYQFSQWQQDAGWGCGLWGFNSHASTSGQSIMSWALTTDGQTARNTAYAALLATGLRDLVDIYASQSAGGYGISVTPSYLASQFRSEQGLVFNGSCYGHACTGSWTGARCVLDFAGDVTNVFIQTQCDSVFTRMNGERGINNRQAFYAISGTTMSFSGDLLTVLSPTITAISVAPNTVFHDKKTVTVTFDAMMDQAVLPFRGIDVDGLKFLVMNARWLSAVQLAADLRPQYIGTDSLRIIAQNLDNGNYDALVSDGGIPLDGSGVGPNRDDRTLPIISAVDNPAATLADFRAVRDGNNVRIEWRVESQSLTDRYVVQRKLGDGTWGIVAIVPADSSRFDYAVFDVGQSDGRYQLLEVERTGRTLLLDEDEVRDDVPASPDPVWTDAQSDSLNAILQARYPHSPAQQPDRILPIYGIAYIFPERWRTRVEPLMNRRASQGYEVNGVSLESIGWENGIQPFIRDAYQYGLWGVTIVSRFTDSRAWNKTEWWVNGWVRQAWAEDSMRCVLHVPFVHDVADSQYRSVSWYTPHVPFIPFGDVDGDSLPEVVVSVIPADTTYEVTNAINKILAYDNLDVSRGTVLVAAQARNLIGNDGSLAGALADTVAKLIPPPYTVKRLTDTDATAYAYQTREDMFKAMVNPTDATNRVVGMVLTGVSTNASNWHWVTRSSFDWGEIAANAGICAVAGFTCELGGHTRRRDQTVGIRTSSSALVSWPDRGPALVIGPGCGSNQLINREFGIAFMNNVRTGARSGPDAAMKAARLVALNHAGHQPSKHAMMSIMSIGDVASKWPGMTVSNVGVENGGPPRLSFAVWPNPMAGRGAVRLSLAAACRVQLNLIDVAGRRVVELANGEFSVGDHLLPLRAEGLAAGVYFLRLQAGHEVRVQRMVLLH